MSHAVPDVVVIGAGPAGAVAALQAARAGARTRLVERAAWPRDKVCGGCLGGVALDVLERVGLRDDALTAAAPIRRVRVTQGQRHADLPLPDTWAIDRRSFDDVLVRAAVRAGVEFTSGVRATIIDHGGVEPARVRMGDDDGAIVEAGAVVMSTGLTAGSARLTSRSVRIGLGTWLDDADGPEPGILHMLVRPRGYVGIVRLADGGLDVGVAVDPDLVRRRGPAGAVATLVPRGAAGVSVDLLREATWRGTPPLRQRASDVAVGRVLLAGDRAGYVEPFTGEGIGWAAWSGLLAGPLAARLAFGEAAADVGAAWARAHARHLGPRQRRCAIVSGMVRRPAVVATALALASRRPGLAKPVLAARGRVAS